MATLATQLKQTEQKNAELNARLELRERIHAAVVTDLDREKRALEEQVERPQRKILEKETERAQLASEYSRLVEVTTLIKEELAWFKGQVYGRSSEKASSDVSPDQAMLFNEPEVLMAIADAIGEEDMARITVGTYDRPRKPGKKAIPKEFPRIALPALDIPEDQRVCPHDGTALEVIGQEQSERYHFVPPKLEVHVQTRLKRACPHCHQGVKIAPVPPHILPKSMASASMLAHITTAKYVDGLPLTRQSKQFEGLGMSLGAATMATWINTIGADRLPPLIALMHEAALNEPVLHCDETPVQVLKSEKAATSEHYMIVRAAGPPGQRIVLYNYAPTRNVATLKNILTGPDGPYRGKLVCDGLELYDFVGEDPSFAEIILCGCLVHCRRYYDKSAKVTESPSGQQLARAALKEYLGKVFQIERQIEERRQQRERNGGIWILAETLKIRQERSAPIMTAFKAWVDELLPAVPPKSSLSKALAYTASQWTKLTRFLEHPEVPPHNNRVESVFPAAVHDLT